MIYIDRVSVMNLENAVRGARNPMNSWGRSDSFFRSIYLCVSFGKKPEKKWTDRWRSYRDFQHFGTYAYRCCRIWRDS